MNWFPDLNTTEIIVLLLSETRNKDNNKQREIYIVNFIYVLGKINQDSIILRIK